MPRRKDLALYTLFRHCAERECFYCGDPADTVDHCPPISRRSDYRALALRHEVFVKVLCCGECNALLGRSLQVDLIDREQALKHRLEKRYEKILATAPWTDDEIEEAELDGPLKLHVQNHAALQRRIIARLDYNRGINALLYQADKPSSGPRLVTNT